MIDHLRLVRSEFLQEILGQRCRSREPQPTVLKGDRGPARCTASMRRRALMATLLHAWDDNERC
jgi:hypothetical protein